MLVHCQRPKNALQVKPQLKIAHSFIKRGNLRKCLECKGVPIINFKLRTVTGFQPIDKPYWHKADCGMEGKF